MPLACPLIWQRQLSRKSSPDAEFDAHGRLLGLGRSIAPTSHEVVPQGRDRALHAWCAADALLLQALINESAQITRPVAPRGK